MLTYKEYREAKSKSVNELPIFWAFSNEQFKKAMEQRGLTENDTDKIYKLPVPGGFYLRKDSEIIRAYFSKEDEILELIKNKKFAYEAFNYEMDNHEYAINYYQGDWDVLSCFFDCEWADNKTYVEYLTECGYADLIDTYERARKSHFKRAENWF